MTLNFVYKGAKEICEAVGLNPREMNRYVSELGLPAWKIDNKGNWFVLEEDLIRWVYDMRNIYLRRSHGNATQKPAMRGAKLAFRVLAFPPQRYHSLPRGCTPDEAG